MRRKRKMYIERLSNGRYSWRIKRFLLDKVPKSFHPAGVTFKACWDNEEDAERDLMESIWREGYWLYCKWSASKRQVPPFKIMEKK